MTTTATTTVAITGAAGAIGTALCAGLTRDHFRLIGIDRRTPTALNDHDEARVLDLTDLQATISALRGADVVVHLAAHPAEATFEDIHRANVVPTHHVYEAARRLGIRRVVYASSVHVTGFYPWEHVTSPMDPLRPDTYYALSKIFGEGLGSMYADRYGLEVVNLRIVGFAVEPSEAAFLWGWLSPPDAVRLVTAAVTARTTGVMTCYGTSDNTRRMFTRDGWGKLGYEPHDNAERFAHRWPDARPPQLQGMTFTDPAYVGDRLTSQ